MKVENQTENLFELSGKIDREKVQKIQAAVLFCSLKLNLMISFCFVKITQ